MDLQNRKKEIALLGGAFDPVTRGHIQIGEYVLDQCKIFDEVWLMPCFSHIYNKQMTNTVHRQTMCEIATSKYKLIKTFDYEIKNRISRETYFIIQHLLKENFSLENFNYSLIIGQDNANTFHHWIHYDLLRELIRFVVVPRKGIAVDKKITWYLQSPHIYLTNDSPVMEVSSSMVRNLIKQKNFSKVKNYLDPDILDYILMHDLYQE